MDVVDLCSDSEMEEKEEAAAEDDWEFEFAGEDQFDELMGEFGSPEDFCSQIEAASVSGRDPQPQVPEYVNLSM